MSKARRWEITIPVKVTIEMNEPIDEAEAMQMASTATIQAVIVKAKGFGDDLEIEYVEKGQEATPCE